MFLVTILTLNKSKEWEYEPETEIIIPVLTNSRYNAERKIYSKYCGSEYPSYWIKSTQECDRFLFQPIL